MKVQVISESNRSAKTANCRSPTRTCTSKSGTVERGKAGVRALFSVFGQVEKGRDVGGKFVGDRRFT